MKKLRLTLTVHDGDVEKQSYAMVIEGIPPISDQMSRKEPMRWMVMDAVMSIRETYAKLRPVYEDSQAPKGKYNGE